jgi:ABC-type enterochelin transport system permease subunit
MPDSKALLDEAEIRQVLESEVLNSKGEKIKLGSTFTSDKTILVFIRELHSVGIQTVFLLPLVGHFFCGVSSEISIYIFYLHFGYFLSELSGTMHSLVFEEVTNVNHAHA